MQFKGTQTEAESALNEARVYYRTVVFRLGIVTIILT